MNIHGYWGCIRIHIHEENIVFISVIFMDISMDIFISAYPWGPLVNCNAAEIGVTSSNARFLEVTPVKGILNRCEEAEELIR